MKFPGTRDCVANVNIYALCATMADDRVVSEIVTEFFLNTCELRQQLNVDSTLAMSLAVDIATGGPLNDDEADFIPVITGSSAEFYIRPMFSCVGDVDVMCPRNSLLAIPEGTAPPTQLPDEFHSRVTVCEMTDDSQFPGYVYLVKSCVIKCTDDGKYNAEPCPYFEYKIYSNARDNPEYHGSACSGAIEFPRSSLTLTYTGRIKGSVFCTDHVHCMRCLLWPRQAANWSKRQRVYCWPDSATVDCVVSNGCDVVPVAHHLCKQHESLSTCQYRLSFSRAEVVLINSWMPVQQIVYHMLRVFVKINRLTKSPDSTDANAFTNYHVKTLMLWACELKPRSWWTEDLDVVRICAELLHILAVWLDGSRCANYFIIDCNLLDYCNTKCIAGKLMLITKPWLAQWFIDIYVRQCAHIFHESFSQLFDDLSTAAKLQNAVSVVVDLRLLTSNVVRCYDFEVALNLIAELVSYKSITVRSRLYWIQVIAQIDQRLSAYFIAITFLHVARKITENSLTDELLDVLAMTCLQSNDARRWLSARHSSVSSLSQAVMLMKVVANNSRSTVQVIEIELSKAYLYRALRCKDSNCDSIYCLANVYVAVLYYVTGHYQTAIGHCTLVMRSHHSQCCSHVVQGELLPKVDNDIDNVMGLSVFYQYVRTAALNQHVTKVTTYNSAFTMELFANYVHLKCLLAEKCQMLTCMPSLASEIKRYRKCVCEHTDMFITDVLVFRLVSCTRNAAYNPTKDHTKPMMLCQSNTPELVELLQQSAVEKLTELRQLEAQEFHSIRLGCGHAGEIVTTDFEAIYAYKCGKYLRCLQLSMHNVRTGLVGDRCRLTPLVFPYPEFIQLMDNDIVSIIGLITIADKRMRDFAPVEQLSLSLYLMSQCQMKLHHSATLLAATLDHVQFVRRQSLCQQTTLVELVLTLTERKIQTYLVILRH